MSKTKERNRTAAVTAARGTAITSSVAESAKDNLPSEDELVNEIMNMSFRDTLTTLGFDAQRLEDKIRLIVRGKVAERSEKDVLKALEV